MTRTRMETSSTHAGEAPLEWLAEPLRPSSAFVALPRVLGLASLALLLPGLAAVLLGHASVAALVPGLLAAAWVGWTHRRRGAPALIRARKELRLPLLLGGVAAALLTAVAVLPPSVGALFAEVTALLVLPLFGVVAFSEADTLEHWLTQPLPRWRLFLEKLSVTALFATATAAQLLSLSPTLLSPAGVFTGLAVALGLGPVLALSLRSSLNAAAVTWMFSFFAAALVSPEASELFTGAAAAGAVLPVSCAVLAVGPWLGWRFSATSMPDLAHRRLWRVRGATALGTLVRKELRLQVPALAMSLPAVVLWANSVSEHRPDVAVVSLACLGALGALLAGAIPVTSEHEHGTFLSEAAVVPRRAAWRVKVAVSLAVAIAVALVMPFVFSQVTPGILSLKEELTVAVVWADFDRQILRRVVATLLVWSGAVTLTWGAGLFASTLTRRMTTAFVAGLGLLGGAVLAMALALPVGLEANWALFSPGAAVERVSDGVRAYETVRMGEPLLSPGVANVVHALSAVVFCVLPSAVLFRLATKSWGGTPPRVKGFVGLLVAMLVAGFAAGFALP